MNSIEQLATAREERRAEQRWVRLQRTRERHTRRRRSQRGQGLVIFALATTVLLGMAGLSIDSMRVYDLFAREHRAAEAGALAGVLYMPNYYSTAYTSGGQSYTAITRALAETEKNGFGQSADPTHTCSLPSSTQLDTSQEVTVCQISGKADALQVTITEPINVFFMGMLGFQSFNVTATAQAAFLQPMVLGAGSTDSADSFYFGTGGACSQGNGAPPANCNIDPHAVYQASINGPGEMKESGDPYVYCAEGPSRGPLSTTSGGVNGADPSASVSPEPITAYAGIGTNHPQYSSLKCGANQPDQQLPGYFGAQAFGQNVSPNLTNTPLSPAPASGNSDFLDAYNYTLHPSASAALWIYNPSFVPTVASGNSCSGYTQLDYFFTTANCSQYYSKYGPLNCTTACTIFDDPRFYFNVTYTLYGVTTQGGYDRTSDQYLWSQTFAPFDEMPNDLKAHGCNSTQPYYNIPAATQANSSYTGGGNFQAPASGGPCGTVSGSAGSICTYNSATPTPCPYMWYQAPGVTLCPYAGPATSCPYYSYRLSVEVSPFVTKVNQGNDDPLDSCGTSALPCGFGHHAYGLILCQAPSYSPVNNACTGAGTVGPWNDMNITLTFNSNVNNDALPLVSLTPDYAGRTIQFNIFDPGDSFGNSGNTQFMIVPPNTCDQITWKSAPASANYPNWLRTASTWSGTTYPTPTAGTDPNGNACALSSPALQASAAALNKLPSDNIYNGLWVTATCTLPTNFAGGDFWLDVYAGQGNTFDQFAVSVTLGANGSPVHLTQ